MKTKGWLKKAVISAIMLMFAIVAFAQDSTSATSVTDTVAQATPSVSMTTESTPTSATNPVVEFFFTYAGLVLLIQIITGWILKTVPTLGKTMKQVISWVVSVGIAYVGKLYGYGLFHDASTLQTIATGVGLGMVANYLYDAKTLESILSVFFSNKKA